MQYVCHLPQPREVSASEPLRAVQSRGISADLPPEGRGLVCTNPYVLLRRVWIWNTVPCSGAHAVRKAGVNSPVHHPDTRTAGRGSILAPTPPEGSRGSGIARDIPQHERRRAAGPGRLRRHSPAPATAVDAKAGVPPPFGVILAAERGAYGLVSPPAVSR